MSDPSEGQYTETLRADRAEDALQERERQLARVLQMADAWEAEWGDRGIKASMAAGAVRQAIRGVAIEAALDPAREAGTNGTHRVEIKQCYCHGWYAVCSCGWSTIGHRDSQRAAQLDADEHQATEEGP